MTLDAIVLGGVMAAAGITMTVKAGNLAKMQEREYYGPLEPPAKKPPVLTDWFGMNPLTVRLQAIPLAVVGLLLLLVGIFSTSN